MIAAIPLAAVSAYTTGLLATGAAPDSPYGWISTGGLVAVLLWFFLYGVPRKWIPRELHDEQIAAMKADAKAIIEAAESRERDWRQIALTGQQVIAAGQTVARRTVPLLEAALQREEQAP